MGKKGRPTKYKPEYNEIAYKLCFKHGYTDEELADALSVARSTISLWKDEHEEFSDSVWKGREQFDTRRVEIALRDRALGYSHPDEQIFCYQGEVTVVPTTKHYPPDTAAIKHWLNNRDPNRWKDKHEVEHSGDVNVLIDVGEYDDEPI